MKKLILFVAITSLVLQARSAIISFDLMGKAGPGLLSGNENTAITGMPGSGGETGAGIFYDDVTDLLTINVGWGSGNGFTDLTGATTLGHLHGPTTSGGVAAFTLNASAKYTLHTLPGWNNSASSGGYSGTITILESDEAALLNGQFYFNAHTVSNPNGEIRGELVMVPEPSVVVLAAVGAGLTLLRLRRRR